MNLYHLGRFSFKLPKQFTLSTQEQTIYGADVSSKSKGVYSTLDHWRSNLQKIKHLGGINLNETDDILPNIPAVFYQLQGSSSETVVLSAQIEDEDSIFTATLQGNKNQKENIMTTVRTALEAYKHGKDQRGFHVGSGILTSPPSIDELASATFINEVKKIQLEIDIEMAGDILEEYPLLNVNEDIIAMTEEGIYTEVIQQEPYDIGLLKGTKSLLETSIEGGEEETLLNFMWFSAGETANPQKPEILIEASAQKKENEFFAEEQWNDILKSLHFREA